ncbi:hypothetical protein AB0L85_30950 [Streptomyces sp. NPDC052051]
MAAHAVHGLAGPVRRSEDHSLQPGTGAWSTFGLSTTASDVSEYDESDLA